MPDNTPAHIRIDKWLWAARFFKTRNLAKQAIEGGKVHIDGQRVKPSKEIEAGALIVLKQGWDEKQVRVKALSDKRGPAPAARALYEETPESIAKREKASRERKLAGAAVARPATKPNSKQRRHIHRFKRSILSDD